MGVSSNLCRHLQLRDLSFEVNIYIAPKLFPQYQAKGGGNKLRDHRAQLALIKLKFVLSLTSSLLNLGGGRGANISVVLTLVFLILGDGREHKP